jgi:hypothetical protein
MGTARRKSAEETFSDWQLSVNRESAVPVLSLPPSKSFLTRQIVPAIVWEAILAAMVQVNFPITP